MTRFKAADLAWVIDQSHGSVPIIHDPDGGIRSLTEHEIKVARRYIQRAKRQADYLRRKQELEAQRQRDHNQLGMARVHAASRK